MNSPRDFGKVAVFCGGSSHERDISLQSGAAVVHGLSEAGIDVKLVDTADKKIDFGDIDRVFIALHGRDGEDGKIQSLLDFYGVPYTGSRVAASAVSMNKWHTKAIWQSVGIATPAYQVVGNIHEIDLKSIEFPVYVKPVNEGSSIGISHVCDAGSLNVAVELALTYDAYVLIEREVKGKEYTFSFIDNTSVLPLICLQPTTDFYDYEAKYLRDDTQYIVDPPLVESIKKQCIEKAQRAYKCLGMSGWGRVDFMIDERNDIWFIEVNSVPGMTSHSLVPMSAQAVGMNFSETCLAILEGAA